jgi:hypothetical protein
MHLSVCNYLQEVNLYCPNSHTFYFSAQQRAALRRSVQTAKDAYRKANDEMIKWESECMQNRA